LNNSNSRIVLVNQQKIKSKNKKFHFAITGAVEGIELEVVETLHNTMNELNLSCPYLKFKRYHVLLREDVCEA
jgi:hypothetical protein